MAKPAKRRHGRASTSRALLQSAPDRIDRAILMIRGQRVMLDADLAALYGVSTKRFNEQVKRGLDRFPEDFRFRLTVAEFDTLRSQIATSKPGRGGRRHAPYAFVDHGAIMAASVLNSPRAVAVSILVIRAFVRLRHILATHQDLARRIDARERQFTEKSTEHEAHIRQIYALLDEFMNPPATQKKSRIGFRPAESAD